MSPDSLESRLARVEQQVRDLAADVQGLMPLAVSVSRVEIMCGHVQEDLRTVIARMETDATDRRRGQAERQKEDRGRKTTLVVAFVAAAAATLSAVIGAVAVLVQ